MLKLFIELVITGTLIAGGTPTQNKPGDGETIVPKTVKPTIEKGYAPEPWIRLKPFGPPILQYDLQLTPPKPVRPFQIKRLKWPYERSA